MEFRLAEILGMPVSVMKLTLSQNEYKKWILYLQHKQPEITEIQLAVLSTLVSNGLGSKSKVDEFILSKPKKVVKKKSGISEADVRGALMSFRTKKMK